MRAILRFLLQWIFTPEAPIKGHYLLQVEAENEQLKAKLKERGLQLQVCKDMVQWYANNADSNQERWDALVSRTKDL